MQKSVLCAEPEAAANDESEISLPEKCVRRSKRRQQRQTIDAASNSRSNNSSPAAALSKDAAAALDLTAVRTVSPSGPAMHRCRISGPGTGAAGVGSSLQDSSSRAAAGAPAGSLPVRALSTRSRLAAQSGPSVSHADDSEEADAAAAATPEGHDLLTADAASRPVLTGQKRKRQQQAGNLAEPATSVQGARSLSASKASEPDAVTEHSRSTHITPSAAQRRQKSQLMSSSPQKAAERAQRDQQDEVHEPSDGSVPGVRRTGRQRKLTAAAAAAVEDFPSLYQQPARPPASVGKARKGGRQGGSPSSAGQSDWHELQNTGAEKAPGCSQSRQSQRQELASSSVGAVQLSQLVRYGILPAGRHEFVFQQQHPCEVEVLPDGECCSLAT